MKDATIALHYGYEKDAQKTMNVPIYMTTAYEYQDTDHAARLFALEEEGNIYTRIGNPTTRVFERRISALERGIDALAVASGMGAIFYSISNLVRAGDNIIISQKLYGGSITLSTQTLKQFGVSAKYFDPQKPEELIELIDEKTKLILFESIANPALTVPDFEGIVKIANEKGVVTICDNTMATPYGVKPIELGVDVVVHSASKYIVGNGSAIAGCLVEAKHLKEKLKSKRYPQFNEPDESYHGLVYTQKFENPFIARARLALLRDYGAVISPFNSWLLINGLETLHLRIKAHSQNALEIAKFLQKHPKVKKVNYPFLEGDENYEFAKKYLKFGGGILSFELDSYEEAKNFVKKLKIFSLVTNIADSKSLVTHPASTTHQQLSQEELKAAGVPEGLIRLSVGIEDIEDLITDIKKGLD
ncbi:O-acetylhomoserine aminocarboxypropyltransferase/cysteine synthase family protein [Caminibacter pacificus]|uniref:O-succinylhomoserine sulfhydrylase n=1 Tax=Caminibacter pacificus TaxID=1424653 RepID=A0AAJ4RDZ5_9BACT|nr:O-acetylhomoserine aminocarboxypropyltransferase/cysteine synthase family protein [Caminibacter pacificus]NPA87407.1 O-acetylhomoserine aminocarboxypropyltransferase/cysteine synthase [Campylobacterota bacterium]QCI28431.1 O-acetylhomoserine aminocarboxypropyltransferase/cysteine synthase [Caminibacter pacificus]ROR40844.1 O-acetylhomoserine sulfhydrylase [Caminibacter pacificus]